MTLVVETSREGLISRFVALLKQGDREAAPVISVRDNAETATELGYVKLAVERTRKRIRESCALEAQRLWITKSGSRGGYGTRRGALESFLVISGAEVLSSGG